MTTPYAIYQIPEGYKPWGGSKELWQSKAHEVVISGPYETGKTLGALQKLHHLLIKYPGSRALMVRKTYKSLINSAMVTYEQSVLPKPPGHPGCPVEAYGGKRPDWYDYPNGSRLVLGGMDNASKFLSSEFDFIYCPQVEELTLDDWEKLGARATGRADNAPYSQIIGDANPDVPMHWIKQREAIHFIESRHKDNPTLWNHETEEWTDRGKVTMKALNAMTGVRHKRGCLGLWVGREGQVYNYDPAIHLIDRFEIPDEWPRYRVVDFGFTNAFVCQWWAMDRDGRLYRYREHYMSKWTVRRHSDLINEQSKGEVYRNGIADHDAEDRATLLENGIYTVNADKRVTVGIEKVEERLKIAGDGKPRLYFLRDSLYTIDETLKENRKPYKTEDEFAGYVYPDRKENRAADEKPIKCDDHGMDAMRYMVMHIDGGGGRESRIW